MGYTGSVVVKKTHLLNMIENVKSIFRSNVSNDSKWNVWGQQMAYENILEEDISTHDWNRFMQDVWRLSWTSSVKPAGLFKWLYNSLGEKIISKDTDSHVE